jgi:TolB-like protein/DNA-binding winged helix-turn-helix (wHTH) protein
MSEMEEQQRARMIRFGPFEVDLEARQLRKQGLRVKLADQPFAVLAALLENAGRVVTREDLRRRLWPPDTHVVFERGLNTAVNRLREALGDSAEHPRFIETLPRRGYCFIAPIELADSPAPHPAEDGASAAAGPAEYAPDESPGRAPLPAGAWSVALAVLLSVVAGVLALQQFGARAFSFQSRMMLAVLPLENPAAEPALEQLGDAALEEIIAELSGVQPARLGVIARSSVIPYRDSPKALEQIGRELGVSYVLEGSVRRNGDRVRITVRLASLRDQTHVWSQAYEYTQDFPAIHQDVAARVARAVAALLLPGRREPGGSAADTADFPPYL